VGELAEAAGLTVRALHHFDEIGLVRPSERSSGGHRLYTEADLRRLYQVLALRQLGVPLAEISSSLDGNVAETMRRQLAQVGRDIEQRQRLHSRITALLRESPVDPTIDQLLTTMEALVKISYFTPAQLARLKARHAEVGSDAFQRWRAEWSAIAADFQAHRAAGTNPADREVQVTAQRWTRLMDDMTGGDPAIVAGMYAKMDGQGAEAATLDVVSSEGWSYVKRALAVGYHTEQGRTGADGR